MKGYLRMRIIFLVVLIGLTGLWLTGVETKATAVKPTPGLQAGRQADRQISFFGRSLFNVASEAKVDTPWAASFDFRNPVWAFARSAAVPFASITVTTTADTIDAAGTCPAVTLASLPGPDGQTSLREAICAANSNPGADTITFSVNGTFALTGAANEDNGGAGDLDIKQSLDIQGNGAANTIIDGSGTERIFDVFPSAASTFNLSSMTIQNGDTRTTSFKEGGAIYLHNNVTSTFNSIQVINNFSASNGAIENRGTLTINNSVISNNQNIPASGSVVGGGIHNAGTLTITNSTISNNTVRGEGGGIATSTGAAVVVTITTSTISGNTASITGGGNGNGGGISTTGNQGTINITNSTISGNRSDNNGGGAYFVTTGGGTGNASLLNVTITNNTADNDNNNAGAGGGIAQVTASVQLRNTIVAGNFNSTTATRDDINGAIASGSTFNLVGDGTGMSGITNGAGNNQVGSGASPVNPLLGPLVNNGGPTETHALLTGSPAIDTGNNGFAPTTDQRGVPRPGGAGPDKGSYEVNDTTPPDTTITGNPTNPSSSSSATFTFTGSDNVTPAGSLTFQCQIDGGGFSACTSPHTYTGLADGSHTFQVRAVDGAGNTDPTPASYTWVVDATAPNTTITANPTNPSASTAAGFSFVGNDGSGTGVASFQCQLDGGGFSTCTSPQTYTGLSQGSHTFQVRAVDGAGNVDPSPASFTWVVDTVVPETTITANPTNPSASANASFSFTGSDPGGSGVASFQCQLDGGGFSTCTSPQTYTGLSQGSHTFQVRAVDAAGNVDPTPASFTWVIDSTAPDTTITANPTNPSNSANASFSFTGNDGTGTGVASFQCQLDGGGFSTCTSPQTYTGLADGSHTFQVRAVDLVGNADPTPASFTWLIDTTGPDTTITSFPPNPTASPNASFSFTGTDGSGSGAVGFQCKLDGGGFTPCTSPQTYTGLADGSHTFQVRAIDAVGNVDPTPATYTWLISTTPPVTTANVSGTLSCPGVFAGSATVTLSASAATGVAETKYRINGGPWQTYTGPFVIATQGNNTVEFYSTDNVGNVETTKSITVAIDNCDQPPKITPANLSRAAGSAVADLTIANANDTEDPEDKLRVQISTDGTNFFDSLTAGSVTVALKDQNANVANVNPNAAGEVLATITTPCNSTVGPLNLFLRVTDTAGQTDTKPWTLTITPNTPPVLTYNATTVTAGTTPTIPPATGPSDNGTFTIGSVSVSPNNGGLVVALNQSNGVVTVLSALLVGTYTVTVPITDNCGATNNAQLIVTVVCPTITLNPSSLPNATINTAYGQTITASPAGGNYSFSATSGLLPAGLTLNSNGSFSGAPTQSGTFNFRVTASGFGGCTGFRDYVLIVECPGLTLNPSNLPGGSVGTAYSQSVTASPAGTYSYAVSGGALPTGLTLNASTGAITGTPTTAGSFTFTLTATAGSCTTSRTYTVTIACPTITLSPASPLPGGQAGVAYSQTINVSPAGTYTFSLASGNLPNGLTLNPTTGVISGTATVIGTYNFTVQAQTATGCSGTGGYALVITCPTVVVSPASLPAGTTGTAYSQTFSASPAGGNYTYAVTSGTPPTGLNLNPSTGVLSGTPTANGSFSFRITATGFGSCPGVRDYTIVIGGGGCPTITLPSSLPNGSVGQLYSNSVAASPAGSYDYTVTGTLPPGVSSFGAIGLVYGYPTTSGSYTFTVTATQGACSGSQSYTVLIGTGFASSLTAFSDFDGDGKSDLSVFRGGSQQEGGNWLSVNSGNGQLQTTVWGSSAAPYNDVAVSGDYDGDGKTDRAVFRRGGEHAGYWFIKRSSDGQVTSHFWGLPTDIPVPGDYDADGKTDVAVWRASAGAWYIVRSSDGVQEGHLWGSALRADMPVPGDYDGDGKTDLAVFRRADGYWHIKRSSDGSPLSVKLGVGTDVAVPGDYDGDGKTDLTVWRASEGNWYILESSSAASRTVTLGGAGDVPVVADYDGDGKADVAFWQASTGTWTVKSSKDGAETITAFGQRGDTPVMARKN